MIYTATVANGAQNSDWIHIGTDTDCNGVVAIVTPSALTSTTLTIQASLDNGTTVLAHYDFTGSAYTVPCAADRWIALDPALFAGIPFIRVVMGSAEGAARTLKLVVREIS
jgi:hypothetical protein